METSGIMRKLSFVHTRDGKFEVHIKYDWLEMALDEDNRAWEGQACLNNESPDGFMRADDTQGMGNVQLLLWNVSV